MLFFQVFLIIKVLRKGKTKEKTFKAFLQSIPMKRKSEGKRGQGSAPMSEIQKTSSSFPQRWNKELGSVRVRSVCQTQTRLDLDGFTLAGREGVMK